MVVGVLEVVLALGWTESLKEKRSVVKRVISRCRQRFNVAAAEVEAQDERGTAVIGIVTVANDGRFVQSVLQKIESFIDNLGLAEISYSQISIEHY